MGLCRNYPLTLTAVTRGGDKEHGRRAGTENVAGIVGLGAAAEQAQTRMSSEPARQSALRDRLYAQLQDHLGPRIHLNGHPIHRLPNTLNISIDGIDGADRLAATPAIAASTGSACHHDGPSPALAAMGLSAERARGAIRLSAGTATTDADIDHAASALAAAALELLRSHDR